MGVPMALPQPIQSPIGAPPGVTVPNGTDLVTYMLDPGSLAAVHNSRRGLIGSTPTCETLLGIGSNQVFVWMCSAGDLRCLTFRGWSPTGTSSSSTVVSGGAIRSARLARRPRLHYPWGQRCSHGNSFPSISLPIVTQQITINPYGVFFSGTLNGTGRPEHPWCGFRGDCTNLGRHTGGHHLTRARARDRGVRPLISVPACRRGRAQGTQPMSWRIAVPH